MLWFGLVWCGEILVRCGALILGSGVVRFGGVVVWCGVAIRVSMFIVPLISRYHFVTSITNKKVFLKKYFHIETDKECVRCVLTTDLAIDAFQILILPR